MVMVAKAYSEISIHALREEGDPRNCCSPRRRRRFLSTPSARRATLLVPYIPAFHNDFYPRPPRGGRREKPLFRQHHHEISIHALREEGDEQFNPLLHGVSQFLSTPSARRATSQNPSDGRPFGISIHALREEGDTRFHGAYPGGLVFLSTPSARRATVLAWLCLLLVRDFYPRPPRGGRRLTMAAGDGRNAYFYPRPPRGGRQPVSVLRR